MTLANIFKRFSIEQCLDHMLFKEEKKNCCYLLQTFRYKKIDLKFLFYYILNEQFLIGKCLLIWMIQLKIKLVNVIID